MNIQTTYWIRETTRRGLLMGGGLKGGGGESLTGEVKGVPRNPHIKKEAAITW